jgi:tight adherence protein B
VSVTTFAAMALCGLAILLWPAGISAGISAGDSAGDHAAGPVQPRSTSLRHRWNAVVVRTRRTRRRDPGDVVPVMDALAAALRAGLSTRDAVGMAAEAADIDGLLLSLVHAAEEGRPLGHEWRRLARRTGHPDLSTLAQAWTISERLGCPLAEAVSTSAATARARAALAHRLDAATAGARASCTLLTLLPLGGLALTPLLGLTPAEMYAPGAAMAAAVAGVALLLFGRWMVRRMVARVTAAVG